MCVLCEQSCQIGLSCHPQLPTYRPLFVACWFCVCHLQACKYVPVLPDLVRLAIRCSAGGLVTPCHCPPSGCSSTPPSVTLGALTRFRYLSLKVSQSPPPPQPFSHYLISAAMTPLFGLRSSNIILCSHRNQTGQRALNGV